MSFRIRRGSGESDAPRRYPYPADLLIDGHRAHGRDISQTGISASLDHPLPVGQVVVVTLGLVPRGAPALSAPARVVRVAPEGDRYIVGLEFLRDSAERPRHEGDEP